MTKASAIHHFWNSFGIKAYEENVVYDVDKDGKEIKPEFPYIIYQLSTSDFGNDVALTASLWYRSSSWVEINAKTDEISEKIGLGGYFINCKGGKIWIKRGTPFAQNMGDESDNLIKRKYINITAEFFTAD